eukprot:gene11922-13890_t
MENQSTPVAKYTLRGELKGHNGAVTSIAISADNADVILSSSRDRTIMVWKLTREQDNYGIAHRSLHGHSHYVQDVVISHDGQFALSGSWDGTLRLWDINSGVTTRRFQGHEKDVTSVAFSYDHRQIISGSRDKTIRVWNTIGECKYVLEEEGHSEWVSCVRFSPNTPTIVSGGWDNKVKVWDIKTFKCIQTLEGHTGYINTVTISPDGSLCASGGKDQSACLWELASGKPLYKLDARNTINALAFSPNKYWLCAATDDKILIWDLLSKTVLLEITIPKRTIAADSKRRRETKAPACISLAWAADGNTLYAGYTDHIIRPLREPSEFPKNDNQDYFKFKVIHQSSKSSARVTEITTPHGVINTPNFVPVATVGSIKFVDPVTTRKQGSQLMFVNTYHMLVNADLDVIQEVGGLHNFINYQGPIITDSGGFQVFSMGHPDRDGANGNSEVDVEWQDDDERSSASVKSLNSTELTKRELKGMSGKKYPGSIESITDAGVTFKSYKTHSKIKLTPESSIQIQKTLGADIIIPFDELPPYHIDRQQIINSLHRTHHWEGQSLLEHLRDPRQQAIYAVIHGGVDMELRRQSVDYLCSLPFDGVAIGGSIGKDRDEMNHLLTQLMPLLPKTRPNHLLGIGDLESIQRSVPLGIDTFDSSYPTRAARHGSIITQDNSRFLITKAQYRLKHDQPLDKTCDCPTCTNYSIAYMHHLYKANEQIFYTLATQHNLRAMARLMETYRNRIIANEI